MKKFEQLEQLSREFDEKLARLQSQKRKVKQELAEARDAYQQIRINNFDNDSREALNEVVNAQKPVKDLERFLDVIDDQLELLEQARKQRLVKLLPDVVEEFNKIYNNTYAEIEKRGMELKKLRCEYLLKCRDLYEMGNNGRIAYNKLQNISRMLGVKFDQRFELPVLNLTSTYAGLDAPLAPLPNEVNEAYRLGIVPAFVEYYWLTGEIVPSHIADERIQRGEV